MIAHTRSGMGVDDNGGICGEYEVKNVTRSDTCGVVYHDLQPKVVSCF